MLNVCWRPVRRLYDEHSSRIFICLKTELVICCCDFEWRFVFESCDQPRVDISTQSWELIEDWSLWYTAASSLKFGDWRSLVEDSCLYSRAWRSLCMLWTCIVFTWNGCAFLLELQNLKLHCWRGETRCCNCSHCWCWLNWDCSCNWEYCYCAIILLLQLEVLHQAAGVATCLEE